MPSPAHDTSPPAWGPRPAPQFEPVVALLSRARSSVLDLLGAQSAPVTVAHLAELSGQHHNTVREHLDGLVAAGLAESFTSPAQGRGRPALLYRVVPPERSRPHLREHARLASAMAGHLARTSPDPAAEARDVGLHWGLELAGGAEGFASYVEAGAAGLVPHALQVLRSLGYDPADPHEGAVLLRQCPVLDVARRHPEVVCRIHVGVIEGLYVAAGAASEGVSIEPFAHPQGCWLRLPGDPEAAAPD
ncbi:MAG: helix-turn-helix domain-containing protein [Austwickia sp.]|jgi:predicted ArsR family transcriptional regulator|nr:helix-turn-helix domain-containing protein [Austwickia sp.]MBK8437266.1 helix-turn-helix domain-containing protein [Austwickia sp.]MBK9102499.1 helix-turn-helix domain-containing protein [Austwickia sp.]